jgi:hypothetical protein
MTLVYDTRVGEAWDDDFERAFRELETAMRQRDALRSAIRREAFQRIEADATFSLRQHLVLLSPNTVL